MIVTAWNNGMHHQSGAGYGLKLCISDRNRYFNRAWHTVTVKFGGSATEAEVNIDKDSFWSASCRELISREIGTWLRANKLAPWPANRPPKLHLEPLGERTFLLRQ